MPADRPAFSPVDLVAVVVGPVLVMLMVGSLTWFLVDVLYAGQYSGRLLWTMTFFVFGAVLIARIAIENGTHRASAYGAGLGGAVFLAMLRFVNYRDPTMAVLGPVINLGLMALVWWLANKLTWDCTHLEDDRRVSGRGLLAAAGLDASTEVDADDCDKAARRKKKDPGGFAGWLARIERFRKARRERPHTPGTWVLYIGLAAIPVFALGQSLIPAGDSGRRWSTLVEMAVFVGSGLGLLVTTSLLALREYLRERNARMSTTLTFGWLGLGAGLVGFFLVVAALLPRPHSEVPWFDMTGSGKSERGASRYAQRDDGSAGKGDGATGSKSEDDANAKGQKDGDGKTGRTSQDGSNKTQGKSGAKGDKSSKGKSSDRGKSGEDNTETKSGDESVSEESSLSAGEETAADSGSESSAGEGLKQTVESVGKLLKWLVWIVIALAVLAAVAYFVLKGLAPFTDWARGLLDWFRNLFSREASKPSGRGVVEVDPVVASGPPPFAVFSNPFTDGTAGHREPRELAAYTFAAFDSWAWDRDLGRADGETPAEFAGRLGLVFPDLTDVGRRAADLAIRAAYSPAELPADARRSLADFWRELEQHP